jgi:hypothetical protein
MSNASAFSNEETEPLTSRQLADGDLRMSTLAIEDRQAPGLDPYEQSNLTRNAGASEKGTHSRCGLILWFPMNALNRFTPSRRTELKR